MYKRQGIKPEMYALSTIMFVTVLVLLFLVNVTPDRKEAAGEKRLRIQKKHKVSRLIFRKVLPTAMVIVIIAGGFFYGSQNSASGGNQVIVYNWGEYLDPEVITMFEEETGIDVVYEEYETNEIMFPKIQSGAIAYDVVCPSDYMVQRMIENDLLSEINFDNVPNIKYIDSTYMTQSRQFDPENKYSVPYLFGTCLLYTSRCVIRDSSNLICYIIFQALNNV